MFFGWVLAMHGSLALLMYLQSETAPSVALVKLL
jgi:hypothetical protein